MMNPRIRSFAPPFDYIGFFCDIIRLGALVLYAPSNPTLRADAAGIPLGRTTALEWGYKHDALNRAFCFAQARNLVVDGRLQSRSS